MSWIHGLGGGGGTDLPVLPAQRLLLSHPVPQVASLLSAQSEVSVATCTMGCDGDSLEGGTEPLQLQR